MLALDTETTGLDLNHGAKPFLVTICDSDQNNQWWEWDVDPLTRKPKVKKKGLKQIKKAIKGKRLVFHNPKFDFRALDTISEWPDRDWIRVDDILTASHLVASNQPHNLTTLSLIHLGINVKPYEDAIQQACNEARRMARSKFPDWRIAKEGLPDMPSVKEKAWKNDMWLPRALAKELDYKDDHPWWTVCSDYANVDSASTVMLHGVFKDKLKELGLQRIYRERLRLLPIIYAMESGGITLSKKRKDELYDQFKEEFDEYSKVCLDIAKKKRCELALPKGASPTKTLREFCFGPKGLNLPVVNETDTGNPSLDKDVKEEYLLTLNPKSLRYKFIEALDGRAKLSTSINYMNSYEKFMHSIEKGEAEWFKLYSSLNPTGTQTLRMSSNNPNQQQISKRKLGRKERNLRYLFGPAPGKVWTAIDYDNLELRIPAYECREPAMLELFENPDRAPFFGSYHLLIVSILHAVEWKQCLEESGPEGAADLFRKKYKDTLYGWTKNGNFAELYGAVDKEDGTGTADKAFHVKGAQSIIGNRLSAKNKLNKDWIAYATENGYVETMPDVEVCPERGYPLWCSRTRRGIKPTVPLNYHVQGTACWIMMRAMIKVQDYFNELPESAGARIVMNVHDELVLEFSSGSNWKPKARKVRSLMESVGKCLRPNVKLTCGIDVHPSNWSQSL